MHNAVLPPAASRGWSRSAVHLLLAVAAYVLATRLLSPGFFSPTVPAHSDIWRYYAFSREPFELVEFTSPRPLMVLLVKLLGVIPDFGVFVLVLLGLAIALPVCLLLTVETLAGIRAGRFPAFVYYLLSFALPSFYELQVLDFGGCMAGILACAAAVGLARGTEVNAPRWARVAGGLALFTWLSMEAKPTYAAVLAAVPFLLMGRLGLRRTLALSLTVCAVVVGVLLKDKLLGSPFLDTSSAGGQYRVAAGFEPMIASLRFYVAALLPLPAWVLALVAGLAFGLRLGWRPALAVPLLALAAIAPMLAIPTHQQQMYAWYGASLLLLPVAFAAQLNARAAAAPAPRARYAVFAVWVLAAFALVASVSAQPVARGWYEYQQQANRNTLRGIDYLRARLRPGQRMLVAGPLNAFTPFKNDAFISLQFGHALDWSVTVPASDEPLIAMSNDTRRLVPAAQVDPQAFDVVAYFDRDGRLTRMEPASALATLDPALRTAAMLCGRVGPTPGPSELAAIDRCLQQYGEPPAQPMRACSAESIRAGAGWYPAEQSGRWLGARGALTLPPCNCPLRMRFTVPVGFAPRELQVADANGKLLASTQMAPAQTASIELPPSASQAEPRFSVSRVTVPKNEIAGNPDLRELGALWIYAAYECPPGGQHVSGGPE